jgi:L-lactate dehydrogenase
MKVGIVGMGWVGASVAISTLMAGVATELLVNDIQAAMAEGEALDLAHGELFYPSAAVRAVSLAEMLSADAVVIAAGRNSRPGETRLNLLSDNATIVRGIAAELKGFRGILIVVTNPLDIMTTVAAEASELPRERVIGTGTMLDTARVRHLIGRELKIDPRAVHGYVIGEHGDSSVTLWSGAHAGGVPLSRWPGWNPAAEMALSQQVRRAAYEIISRKGATNHAIGLVTASLLEVVLRNERRVLTVSRVQEGAFGIHDLALSLPTVVGRDGAIQVLEPDVSEAERAALIVSWETLKKSADLLRS